MTETVDVKIGVVGTPGKWSTEALADALEAGTGFRLVIDMGQVTLDLAGGRLLYDGMDLATLDGLVVKKIAESYSVHALDRLEMLRIAEAQGVKVFSRPEAILRLMDRLACTVTLRNAGAPMPPTIITEDAQAAFKAVCDFGSAVFKPLFSTKARGMFVLDHDAPDAQARIAAFKAENPVMYIQKKADLSGQDLGMVFLNGTYVCTYRRIGESGSWNTTINSGGKYAPYEPTPDLIALGHKAQAPFGLTFTTVDIALTPEGPIVFEVSAFGGYSGALKGCGVDAMALMADHVVAEVSG
ncbi:GAK system ATP-grasp enzyme [Celeribacter halophilus]|uniref:Ribosomal protein S6--L-glutamate ligase n=1 Tax=Celeribacter halophilus TaxID=576117 RepID=A0A1I3QA28_9RHOB|nr:GAK system ATP-grasp enzyme [Celeribacter halophilus]PZX14112.1 SSU ribosomal protein S6P modification protein [Celeribacter halophilus]SFJ30181.1 ribosomal protein S6--L-glutamate ligase [Celeribacter halophilus]